MKTNQTITKGREEKKQTIWKAGKQNLAVLVEVDKKTYQVELDKDQVASLAFILPQLFDDHKIKIIDKELPITLPHL